MRLHVVAASDALVDQLIKLEARAALLGGALALTRGARDPREALCALASGAARLERAAAARLRELGCSQEVRVRAGRARFEQRPLGRALAPAGDYDTVRVTLGGGGGANWWCLIYPFACGEGELYSALWRWLRGLFSKGGA